MDKLDKFIDLTEKMKNTYQNKNADYGDSFGISYRKYGKISALTRMSDKFNRIENIMLGKETKVKDETLLDSLMDLANYALMTVIELEG